MFDLACFIFCMRRPVNSYSKRLPRYAAASIDLAGREVDVFACSATISGYRFRISRQAKTYIFALITFYFRFSSPYNFICHIMLP